jgi:hypothetical protein
MCKLAAQSLRLGAAKGSEWCIEDLRLVPRAPWPATCFVVCTLAMADEMHRPRAPGLRCEQGGCQSMGPGANTQISCTRTRKMGNNAGRGG